MRYSLFSLALVAAALLVAGPSPAAASPDPVVYYQPVPYVYYPPSVSYYYAPAPVYYPPVVYPSATWRYSYYPVPSYRSYYYGPGYSSYYGPGYSGFYYYGPRVGVRVRWR
jgi:hypothetical protein